MTQQQIEDLFIRSLDAPMAREEEEIFTKELQGNVPLARHLSYHKKIRELVRSSEASTFGPYFASKLITKIQNTGVVIERQIFVFFKRYQLAAFGVIMALLILNTVFSDQLSIDSILGLNDVVTPITDGIVSFDFYETLNNIL